MSFTCPRCSKTSHHPMDVQHRYCGNCHDFTGNPASAGATHIFVDGIVAHRDKEPYVRIIVNGEKAQLNLAEAKKIAMDILIMAARTEADAMIFRFFSDQQYPEGAATALMTNFRYFRQMQDEKEVEATVTDPDSGERIR